MNILLKIKIQRWFDFLRLAHQSKDADVVAALESSKDFYAPWDDYQNTSFTKWWKDHRHLFRQELSMRRLLPGEEINDDAFYLVVPFTYAPTTAAKIFSDMYENERQAHLNGELKKVKKVYGGTFALTTNDFQVSQFVYYHRFAKDVYLPVVATGNATTKRLVDTAIRVFANQKVVASEADAKREVPFTANKNNYQNVSKQARVYSVNVQNLMLNAALGNFPGDYTTKGVKNQGEKRKISRVVRKEPKYKRGVSQNRYVEKSVREDVLDPYRKTVL